MRDLTPTTDLSGTSITVESVGYETALFPHNARKHLAIIDNTGLIYPRGVTVASDNGTTETLTIAPTLGTTLTAGHTMVSFLVLARLAASGIQWRWITNELVDVTITFVEVPREAPAP